MHTKCGKGDDENGFCKTTRLRLELQYVSSAECKVTVTDLGFGEMFPSSGKTWTETVEW